MLNELFPAQAGVIPERVKRYQEMYTVPRASGGDPWPLLPAKGPSTCSPRKRG